MRMPIVAVLVPLLAAIAACAPPAPRTRVDQAQVVGWPSLDSSDTTDTDTDDTDDTDDATSLADVAEPDPHPCPIDVTCVIALPHQASGSTVGGVDAIDSYGCAPGTDESGPERVFRVTLPGDGTLTVELDTAFEAGAVDVDVHILSAFDGAACLARGDRSASAAVSGTEAWIVLDSFQGVAAAGAFSASITFTPLSDNPLVAAGVPASVAELALFARQAADDEGLVDSPVFTVIDFSRPSYAIRMWTVDLVTGDVLVAERISHGIGSASAADASMAVTFSNVPGSKQSSLGLARTAEPYQGSNGYSLRLDGLEPSNDAMRERAIVVHGAAYAEDGFVDDNGYLGRSHGCPAVAMSRSAAVIDIIKEGTLLFSYYPNEAWLASSPFLQ